MYNVYVQTDRNCGFSAPRAAKTEAEAKQIIETMLNLHHADNWEFKGLYVFKDGRPGDLVAAYYADIDEEKREAVRHAQWLAELPKYGIYGKAGRERITSDAAILAGLVTDTAEIEADEWDLWERFVAAGGDDSHSDGSWYVAKCEAYAIVKARAETGTVAE